MKDIDLLKKLPKCEICYTRDAIEDYDGKIKTCGRFECNIRAQESIDKYDDKFL